MPSIVSRKGGNRVCEVLNGRVEAMAIGRKVEGRRRIGNEGILTVGRADSL